MEADRPCETAAVWNRHHRQNNCERKVQYRWRCLTIELDLHVHVLRADTWCAPFVATEHGLMDTTEQHHRFDQRVISNKPRILHSAGSLMKYRAGVRQSQLSNLPEQQQRVDVQALARRFDVVCRSYPKSLLCCYSCCVCGPGPGRLFHAYSIPLPSWEAVCCVHRVAAHTALSVGHMTHGNALDLT